MNKGVERERERERERWLLPFSLRSFRFFFSCVGVSDLTEEDEEEGEACLSCAAKSSVVLCFVCFLSSCFSCGGENEFGEELKIES